MTTNVSPLRPATIDLRPRSLPTDRRDLRSSERYYQLNASPFSPGPETPFFYRSSSHGAALDEMLAAIGRGDHLVVLTGDAGSGRTTVCHALRRELDQAAFAMITPDPSWSREDFLKALLVDLGVATADELESGSLRGASELELSSRLYQFINFSPTPRSTVLVFDEVHEVEPLLDEVGTLSDLEKEERHLHVVLVGPPSCRKQLTPTFLKRADPRAPACCGLKPFTVEEVGAYVRHRLAAVGAVPTRIHFSREALEFIALQSAGIPRTVNEMCDRAIEQAYLTRAARIDQTMVTRAGITRDVDEPVAATPPGDDDVALLPAIAGFGTIAKDATGLDLDFDLADLPPSAVGADDRVGQSEQPAPYVRRSRRSMRHRLRNPVAVGAIALMGSMVVTLSLGTWMRDRAPVRAVPAVRSFAAVAPVPPRSPEAAPAAAAPAAAVPAAGPDEPAAPVAREASIRIAEPGATYLIEVATFRRPAGAATLVQQLRAVGLTANDRELDLGARGVMRQVVVGPYDGADADSALARVHEISDYRDAKMRRVQPR